jgi:hypothetical protein
MGVWPEIANGTDINACDVSGDLVPIRLNFGKQLSFYFEIFFPRMCVKFCISVTDTKFLFLTAAPKKVKSSIYNFLGGPFQVSSISYG